MRFGNTAIREDGTNVRSASTGRYGWFAPTAGSNENVALRGWNRDALILTVRSVSCSGLDVNCPTC